MFNNTGGTHFQKTKTDPKFMTSGQSYKGIGKAENCTIEPGLLNSGKITFSSLVSMSDTVNLLLDKFKFHLELYNSLLR